MVAPLLTTIFETNTPVIEQTVNPEEEIDSDGSIMNLNDWLKAKMDKLFRRATKSETLKLLCF
jgi:hypothetical protein